MHLFLFFSESDVLAIFVVLVSKLKILKSLWASIEWVKVPVALNMEWVLNEFLYEIVVVVVNVNENVASHQKVSIIAENHSRKARYKENSVKLNGRQFLTSHPPPSSYLRSYWMPRNGYKVRSFFWPTIHIQERNFCIFWTK